MCEWCDEDKIQDYKKYHDVLPSKRIDCIVKSDENYFLWLECEDWYYSGNVIELNYCPICGRKLK